MVAQASAFDTCNFRHRSRPDPAFGGLICPQTRQCVARKLRIILGHAPYQFEKQRKRAWRSLVCAFMLQRTMLR
jgi:hypothetical protein